MLRLFGLECITVIRDSRARIHSSGPRHHSSGSRRPSKPSSKSTAQQLQIRRQPRSLETDDLGGTPAEPESQERGVALASEWPKCVERMNQLDCRTHERAGCPASPYFPSPRYCLQLVTDVFAGIAAPQLAKGRRGPPAASSPPESGIPLDPRHREAERLGDMLGHLAADVALDLAADKKDSDLHRRGVLQP